MGARFSLGRCSCVHWPLSFGHSPLATVQRPTSCAGHTKAFGRPLWTVCGACELSASGNGRAQLCAGAKGGPQLRLARSGRRARTRAPKERPKAANYLMDPPLFSPCTWAALSVLSSADQLAKRWPPVSATGATSDLLVQFTCHPLSSLPHPLGAFGWPEFGGSWMKRLNKVEQS